MYLVLVSLTYFQSNFSAEILPEDHSRLTFNSVIVFAVSLLPPNVFLCIKKYEL